MIRHLIYILILILALPFHLKAQDISAENRLLGADTCAIDSISADDIAVDSVIVDSIDVDSCVIDSVIPWPQSLQLYLDNIIERSELLKTSQLGLMVYDLDADSTLYVHNARQLMRPASTMKLITAITALDKLGGAYQFKTRLKYTGEVIDSVHTLKGDVYLVGGMDPRIGHDDLVAFAESLKKLNIDTIRGSVFVDKSMKHKDLYGEGWCWDDDNPELSACVYGRKDNMGENFLKVLKSCGIHHEGEIAEHTTPSAAKELCSRSHSIDQILHKMMKDSNNLYAESMYYNVGLTQGKPATAKGAQNVEKNLIRKMGLNPSRYRLADGSGLSLYNYVTAELEVRFLRYAYQNSNIFNNLYSSLPIAGEDGTLSKRMRKTKAAGNVHAKTGTLTGISSLAGYVTASNNHRLAFCIINQGVLNGANAKAFQDKVCVELTK